MCNRATDLLYSRVRDQGLRGQLWSVLPGRSKRLFSLDEIAVAGTVHCHRHAGTRTVAIRRIRGSESRAGDFDCDFNPLHDHNKGRWLSVATARQRGKTLPPVALIQVGDVFFVRDGHHRISVAHALGQSAIEATVEIWQVQGPLPWEVPVRERPHRSPHHLTGVGHILMRLRSEGARYRKYVFGLLGTVGALLRSPAGPQPSVDRL